MFVFSIGNKDLVFEKERATLIGPLISELLLFSKKGL